MAHVLVAHADHDVREVVAQALCEEAGHAVVSTPDGVLTLTTLLFSVDPMVALIDERLSRIGGLEIVSEAANDWAGGPLSRHRYVLMSTLSERIDANGWRLLSRLAAPVLSLPFELDTLLQVVEEAAKVRIADSRTALPLQQWPDIADIADIAIPAHIYQGPASRVRSFMLAVGARQL